MAQLRVLIRDQAGSKKTPAELPDDVPMRRLIPALVTRMTLPTSQVGQLLVYKLDHSTSGKRLGDENTLASAGVHADDILTLLPQVTAEMSNENPRLRRLQKDYERLLTLVTLSDLIRIATVEGNPPENYMVEFRCRGVESLNGAKPVYREYHQMGISLPAGYPTKPPVLRFFTPIFHPNIISAGPVCIGPWAAARWLDELVINVAEMIQYQVPPTKDTPGDVFTPEAVAWLRANRHLVPVDRRPIKSMGEGHFNDLLGRIVIGGDSQRPDDSIDIRILG